MDDGPTIGVWFGVLAVGFFFVGLIQSLWWLWEQSPMWFAIFIGTLLAIVGVKGVVKFFEI